MSPTAAKACICGYNTYESKLNIATCAAVTSCGLHGLFASRLRSCQDVCCQFSRIVFENHRAEFHTCNTSESVRYQ